MSERAVTRALIVSSALLGVRCVEAPRVSEAPIGSANKTAIQPGIDELQSDEFPVDVPVGTEFIREIPCGPEDHNVFDIFLPPREHETPLVVYFHGGGFTRGAKEMAYTPENAPLIHEFLTAGVAYASIDYRLLEEVTDGGLRTPLLDAARCLQSLRVNAKVFNFDPQRVAAYGKSAGAVISLWLGAHDDLADPRSADPVARASTRLRAVGMIETQASFDVARWLDQIYAPYELTLDDVLAAGIGRRLLLYYGIESLDEIDTLPARVKRADADILPLIDGGDAPVWIRSELQLEEEPIDSNMWFHHPYHAELVMSTAIEQELEHVAYIPELGVGDGRPSLVRFMLQQLGPGQQDTEERPDGRWG